MPGLSGHWLSPRSHVPRHTGVRQQLPDVCCPVDPSAFSEPPILLRYVAFSEYTDPTRCGSGGSSWCRSLGGSLCWSEVAGTSTGTCGEASPAALMSVLTGVKAISGGPC